MACMHLAFVVDRRDVELLALLTDEHHRLLGDLHAVDSLAGHGRHSDSSATRNVAVFLLLLRILQQYRKKFGADGILCGLLRDEREVDRTINRLYNQSSVQASLEGS